MEELRTKKEENPVRGQQKVRAEPLNTERNCALTTGSVYRSGTESQAQPDRASKTDSVESGIGPKRNGKDGTRMLTAVIRPNLGCRTKESKKLELPKSVNKMALTARCQGFERS